MKGIPLIFVCAAIVCALCGMSWGIYMAITGNHAMAPAHAHLNLVGWVSLSIFGFYYHLVPAAAEKMLAKVHVTLALVGVVIFVPGIYLALSQNGETFAKIGSILTILSMLTFLIVVVTSRKTA